MSESTLPPTSPSESSVETATPTEQTATEVPATKPKLVSIGSRKKKNNVEGYTEVGGDNPPAPLNTTLILVVVDGGEEEYILGYCNWKGVWLDLYGDVLEPEPGCEVVAWKPLLTRTGETIEIS